MSWKSLTCVTVFCALLAGQAMAAPTLSVTGSAAGANTLWTVAITPDAPLLPGSMAVELAFEFPTAQTLDSFTVNPDWMETINGVLIENPGQNPYANAGAGGVTDGVQQYADVASKIGGAGNVNAIFASLGSTIFTDATAKTLMTFTTVGTTGEVSWDGFIAQDPAPNANFFDVSGTAMAGATNKLFDANVDGTVNNLDIDHMVLALGDVAAWQAAHPGLNPIEYLDGNGDGTIDNLDIDSYVAALANPPFIVAPTSAVPEPSTVAILVGTMIGVAGFRRKLCAA